MKILSGFSQTSAEYVVNNLPKKHVQSALMKMQQNLKLGGRGLQWNSYFSFWITNNMFWRNRHFHPLNYCFFHIFGFDLLSCYNWTTNQSLFGELLWIYLQENCGKIFLKSIFYKDLFLIGFKIVYTQL